MISCGIDADRGLDASMRMFGWVGIGLGLGSMFSYALGAISGNCSFG